MGIVRRGSKWAIRYYGPDGRQRWETIGPNKKEAETVLAQRIYEVRSGKFPILQRRKRLLFRDFAEEWQEKHLVRVRVSTSRLYKRLLRYHLLPAFGERSLAALRPLDVQAYIAQQIQSGALAPKTVNNILALLKQMLKCAVDWGYLTAVPLTGVKKLRRPRWDLQLWSPAEIRKFLLEAPEEWQTVWLVGIFAGLRPGEIQAMYWEGQNWPDFAGNKIRITCAYEAESKVLAPTKTDRSVRLVDMVPAVRQALLALPSRTAGGLVFPGADGGMFSRSNMKRAWHRTIKATGVRRIRPYDLRHTFASLLIRQARIPYTSPGRWATTAPASPWTLYGHLMEALPKRQVEWIDELVFPEGWEAALKLHLDGALRAVSGCSWVQSIETPEPLETKDESNLVQSGTAGSVVGARGLEPRTSSVSRKRSDP
jgi:integrase